MKFTRITESEFNEVKDLQDQGLWIAEVSRTLERSTVAVSKMFRCDTWEQYQEVKRNYNRRYNIPVDERDTPVLHSEPGQQA